MKRIVLALVVLLAIGTTFALVYGGCDVPTMTTIDVTQSPYLADKTGATDATAAINSAIAALSSGDTLYFPAGTYSVIAPSYHTVWIFDLSNTLNINVMGDGIGDSTIKVADNSPVCAAVFGGAHVNGVEFYDLTFDHNGANNAVGEADYPNGSIYIFSATSSTVRDIEIINSCSRQNLTIAGGTGVSDNITISNVTASNIGVKTQTDASLFYVQGSYISITGCNLTGINRPTGAHTAMEVHGGAHLEVSGNTVSGFETAFLPCAVDSVAASDFLVNNNTVTDCNAGVGIWSAGYGFADLTISNNDITVPARVGSEALGGIIIDPTGFTAAIDNLTIYHNTITYTLETSDVGYSYYMAIGTRQAVTRDLSNCSITYNTITNAEMPAIRLTGLNLSNVTIANNGFTNCGSTKHTVSSYYKSHIYIDAVDLDTLAISNNAFVDNLSPTRITFFMYLTADTSTGFTITGNTFSGTPTTRQIHCNDNVAQPLITGTIAGFVPPTGQVNTASQVEDGLYTWTTDNGIDWSKDLTGATVEPPVAGAAGAAPIPALEGITVIDSRFGLVQSHLHSMSDADITAAMDHAVAAGVTWIRTVFAWIDIETPEGVWNWTQHDKVIAAAAAHNLNILGVTGSVAAWGNPPSGQWWEAPNEAGMTKWGIYHTALATRYPQIRVWEICNEVNWAAADYVAALQVAYTELKEVDPSLTVSFEGVAGIDATYIGACLDLGADDFCDIYAIHPYATIYNPAYGNYVGEENLRYWLGPILRTTVMDPHTDKPLWVTEFGWNHPTGVNSTTSALAAAYQFRTMVIDADDIGADYNIGKFFMYSVQDTLGTPNEYYGLTDASWDHKPTLGYFKTFQDTIGTCNTVLDPATVGTFTAASMPTLLEKHCFTKADGTVYVALWNRQDTPEGGVENADTVDITMTDTSITTVLSVDLSDGSLTPVAFTLNESDEVEIADLPIDWDAVLLRFGGETVADAEVIVLGAVTAAGANPVPAGTGGSGEEVAGELSAADGANPIPTTSTGTGGGETADLSLAASEAPVPTVAMGPNADVQVIAATSAGAAPVIAAGTGNALFEPSSASSDAAAPIPSTPSGGAGVEVLAVPAIVRSGN